MVSEKVKTHIEDEVDLEVGRLRCWAEPTPWGPDHAAGANEPTGSREGQ
jgi:hypothetical protein